MAYECLICKYGNNKDKDREACGRPIFVTSRPFEMERHYRTKHPNHKRSCPVCLNKFASQHLLPFHYCGGGAAGAAVGGGGIAGAAAGAAGGNGGVAGGGNAGALGGGGTGAAGGHA